MFYKCPYNCINQTTDGYCKMTRCINLNYKHNHNNQNNILIFPVIIGNRYFTTIQDLINFIEKTGV